MKSKLILFLLFGFSYLFCMDTTEVKVIGDGIKFYKIHSKDPISINLLEIELRKKIKVELGIAGDGIGSGGELISEMSKRLINDKKVVFAGINGDFFGQSPRQAENSMVSAGIFAKGEKLHRTLFAIDNNNNPFIDTFKYTGYLRFNDEQLKIDYLNVLPNSSEISVLNKYYKSKVNIEEGQIAFLVSPAEIQKINVETKYKIVAIFTKDVKKVVLFHRSIIILPKSKIESLNIKKGDSLYIFNSIKPNVENLYTLIGGLPGLVKNGKIKDNLMNGEGLTNSSFLNKNPRTAVGFTQSKDTLYFVVADGRDKKSVGFSLVELAKYMVSIGCFEAVNFDGGGSSTMVIRDSVVNNPCDFSGEREVYNGLFVCSDDSISNLLSSLDVLLSDGDIDIREYNKLNIIAKDKWGFPINLSPDLINWNIQGIKGRIEKDVFYPESVGKGKIMWNFNNLHGEKSIIVSE